MIALTATDESSGVAAIRYTLDGSEPTEASTLYSGSFAVSASTTVRFRAWDNAGNAEPTQTQVVRIDTQAPTVAITSPAAGATVKANVKISASAADALSGVVSVSFHANKSLIGAKVGSPFFVNWQTNKLPKRQYTLTAVGMNAAGNSTTSAAVVVTTSSQGGSTWRLPPRRLSASVSETTDLLGVDPRDQVPLPVRMPLEPPQEREGVRHLGQLSHE